MVYVSIADQKLQEVLWRAEEPFDVSGAIDRMQKLDRDHEWTPSGKGFLIRIGQGSPRAIIEAEGIRFAEYRDHYLNLALNVIPVLELAFANARNFQLLQNEQEKLRTAVLARDSILAIVSHDLRNPLSVIELSAQMLEKQCLASAGNAPLLRSLRLIRASLERMRNLIEDLLDISSIEAGALRIRTSKYSAKAVLQEALREVQLLAEERGIELVAEYRSDVELSCDRQRIVQVLSNLLGNAVKFAPAKNGRITAGFESQETSVLFFVSDNGPGIPKEELPHIFDRYWQGRRRKQGVGLGLAISDGIIRAHEGKIWAESTPGIGATFYFSLKRG